MSACVEILSCLVFIYLILYNGFNNLFLGCILETTILIIYNRQILQFVVDLLDAVKLPAGWGVV